MEIQIGNDNEPMYKGMRIFNQKKKQWDVELILNKLSLRGEKSGCLDYVCEAMKKMTS